MHSLSLKLSRKLLGLKFLKFLGFGFVEYSKISEAKKVISYKNHRIFGKIIQCLEFKDHAQQRAERRAMKEKEQELANNSIQRNSSWSQGSQSSENSLSRNIYSASHHYEGKSVSNTKLNHPIFMNNPNNLKPLKKKGQSNKSKMARNRIPTHFQQAQQASWVYSSNDAINHSYPRFSKHGRTAMNTQNFPIKTSEIIHAQR